jgi:hypothetical protein
VTDQTKSTCPTDIVHSTAWLISTRFHGMLDAALSRHVAVLSSLNESENNFRFYAIIHSMYLLSPLS